MVAKMGVLSPGGGVSSHHGDNVAVITGHSGRQLPADGPLLAVGVETPHEQVLTGQGGLTDEELRRQAMAGFGMRRRGHHVLFTVPATRGQGPVRAFCAANGLKVLDVALRRTAEGAFYLVKAMDSL